MATCGLRLSMLTIEEAASAAKVSPKTILRLIGGGRLRATDFGTKKQHVWRVDPADLKGISRPVEPAAEVRPRRRRGQASSGSFSQYPPA